MPPMLKRVKKWGKYYGTKADMAFDDRADPRVQLEQALAEAQDQHRRLRDQAANVIATQKQTELKLNRTIEEFERVQGNARQAVIMADQAAQANDLKKVTDYTTAAEAFANRLIVLEREVEDLKTLALQSTEASDAAKAAVAQNAALVQRKLAERQKLLSQLEQAKMQEQLNTAVASITEVVGGDVPSIEEVRQKIEARYAKAKSVSELSGETLDHRMLEIEQATVNTEAQARLDKIRVELGIAPAGALTSGGAEDPLLAEAQALTTEQPASADKPSLEK